MYFRGNYGTDTRISGRAVYGPKFAKVRKVPRLNQLSPTSTATLQNMNVCAVSIPLCISDSW
jgi:hypothetical protein